MIFEKGQNLGRYEEIIFIDTSSEEYFYGQY